MTTYTLPKTTESYTNDDLCAMRDFVQGVRKTYPTKTLLNRADLRRVYRAIDGDKNAAHSGTRGMHMFSREYFFGPLTRVNRGQYQIPKEWTSSFLNTIKEIRAEDKPSEAPKPAAKKTATKKAPVVATTTTPEVPVAPETPEAEIVPGVGAGAMLEVLIETEEAPVDAVADPVIDIPVEEPEVAAPVAEAAVVGGESSGNSAPTASKKIAVAKKKAPAKK